MESSDTNPEMHEPLPLTGPGGRLVAAREELGLAIADVAKELRLPVATLQALESSRYEDLPQPVFVRGYLRAYARLLEMDEEVLVAEYDRLVDTSEPVLAPTIKVHRQTTSRNPYIRGATALILVAMVVLLGSWWYSRLKHDAPAQSRTTSSEARQTASAASVTPPPQIDSPHLDPGQVMALPPDIPPPSPKSESAEERVATAESGPPMDETAAVTGPALSLVHESPVTVKADAVSQIRDAKTTVEPAVLDLPIAPLTSKRGGLVRASRAPTGEDVLVIRANDESWAEVVDAHGYQLLYYLLHPGMVRHLQGQAPFRVFLGNAPAVDLNLNRERFDHTPFHRRNNTARFSVDDAS